MYTARSFQNETDLQAMIALLPAIRAPDRIGDYPGMVDLHKILADARMKAKTCLWFDAEDHIVGFAIVDLRHNLLFDLRPDLYATAVVDQIIEWGITCLAGTSADTLYAGSRGDDVNLLRLLQRHGFEEQFWRTLRLSRSLHEPIATPELPPGFHIRGAAGQHEVTALVQLHRAAFGTNNMTIERRLATMNVPDYAPELDLIAAAPDGQLAAFCMCSIDHQENRISGRLVGYTDPVGTHPDFRRLGLGQALLQTGALLLKQRGMEFAELGTSSGNIPMQALAMSVDYRVDSEKRWFAKKIAAL